MRAGEPGGNPWGVQFRQGLFNMTSDSALFRTREELEAEGLVLQGNAFAGGRESWLPLYEAKMVHHFDHRWASYQGDTILDVGVVAKQDPSMVVLPRYWVRETEVAARLPERCSWLLGFRDIARATDERTVLATIIPRAAVGNKLPLLLSDESSEKRVVLGACLSSLVLDYVARQKVGGTNLNFYLAEQLPVLPPGTFDGLAPWDSQVTLVDWLLPRVLELYYTAADLSGFAHDLGYDGPPFVWDTDRRTTLRAELDAAFFHLYGVARADVEYVLETFPIVQRNDERLYGEFRTKRLVLEAYDGMTRAMGSGVVEQVSAIRANRA